MIDNTLSVCMIVKNEERSLRRCLESLKDLADEIIIVDTGSSDDTVKIAREYTEKVFFYEWKNDFSDARNKSLEYATKSWVLVIDADEVLPHDEGVKLKRILKENSQFEAFHLRLVNIIYNVDIGDSVVLRVFKNDPNYRFRGKMHEQIIKCILDYKPNGSVGSTDVKILHYGYDPNEADIPLKQKRNLDLLNSYSDEDKDGYFYYALGNEYARIQEYDKALEIYKLCEEYPVIGEGFPVYLCYLAVNVAKTLSAARRFKDEISRLQEYEKNFLNFKDLYFLEYLAQAECGYYSEAQEALVNYSNTTKGCYEYPDGNYESQFNIKELYDSLTPYVVKHEKNLLSILVLEDEADENLINTVKGINEIADEVIIATNSISRINKEKIENIYGKVIEYKTDDRKKMFMDTCKLCIGKFILLLKPMEVINTENQKLLVNELSSTESKFFNVNVAKENILVSTSEFRILKNDEILKSFKDFDEYVKYIDSNIVIDINVQINKVNN